MSEIAAYVVRLVVALARHSALLSHNFAGGHVKADAGAAVDAAAVDGIAAGGGGGGGGSGGSVDGVARCYACGRAYQCAARCVFVGVTVFSVALYLRLFVRCFAVVVVRQRRS